MVLVPCTLTLFVVPASVSQFAAVDRVLQDTSYKGGREAIQRVVLAFFLFVTMGIQPDGDFGYAHRGVNVFVINDADYFGLIFGNRELTIFQLVPVGCKTAVPASLAGFLLAALHGLHENILTLDLSHRRQNGNHQFAAVLGAVDSIFHANQVDAAILHLLQIGKNVCGIAAKTGQFENKNKGNLVFERFNVLDHFQKLRAAFDTLAGFALI